MTPSLSVLLTNVVQGDAANTHSAASTLNALSQATRLATAANVAIVRLPEQILQIQTNGTPKAQIKLPANVDLPSTTKLQLATLSSAAIADPAKADLGVVISQNTGTNRTAVTPQQVTQVAAELSKVLANQPNAKAQVSGHVQQLDGARLQVNLSGGSSIELSVPRQQAASASSLRQGQAVTLMVNSDKNGALQVSVTPKLNQHHGASSSTSSASSMSSVSSVAITSRLAVSDSKAQAIVTNALKQGGVAFVHENKGVGSALEKYLPPVKTATTLQQASLFTLKGNTITTTSVAAQAVTKFPLPASLQGVVGDKGVADKGAAVSDPPTPLASRMNRQLVLSATVPSATLVNVSRDKSSAVLSPSTKVPDSPKAAESAKASMPPVTEQKVATQNGTEAAKLMPNANLQATTAEQIKGSQVHQAIITLSRTLLSQTGSTQQALTQLLAIVNAPKSGADTKAVTPPSVISSSASTTSPQLPLSPQTSQFLNKIGQALTPLNERAPQMTDLTARTTEKTSTGLNAATDSKNDVKVDLAAPQKGHAVNTPEQGQNANYLKRTLSQLTNILLPSNNTATGEAVKPNTANVTANQIAAALNKQSLQADVAATAEEGQKTASTVKDSASTSQTPNLANTTNPPQALSTRIQSLLTMPALAVTPLNLTSPVAASNFVQGLVALLQVSLAGRAMQRQPSVASLIDRPDSAVSKTLANSGVTAGSSSRVAQDVATLDSRSNLLANLKTLLANHQQNKVAQAESRVQGQDSFYYVLPSLSQHTAAPELLIQRESDRHQQKESETGKHSQWNITMKLEIAEVGEVLAKSKIQGEVITLDLYASTAPLLSRIADTLPYLKQRLSDLGLVVESSSFQRGNIPSTLNRRPHQIFETRV